MDNLGPGAHLDLSEQFCLGEGLVVHKASGCPL